LQTKSSPPIQYLQGKQTIALIRVYYEFNQLKLLYRQGWLKRGISTDHCESVADHTLGVAVLAMLIADQYFPGLDMLKVIRLAMIHDFGEIYAGDITPADDIDAQQKSSLEHKAVQSRFAKLPNGSKYLALWQEYEAAQTPEARLVRQVDRLEMGLQASIYSRLGLSDPGEFLDSAWKAQHEPEFKNILEELIKTIDFS
jgi:putative hydrolase of HD superfamily